MKIIISHDVDHLFCGDHWFRDLVYPKLWAHEILRLITGKVCIKECWLRCVSCFRHKRHNIDEVMAFDAAHGVPSTFFFGMNQGLGMSYRPQEARDTIRRVHDAGFITGVHGIVYDDAAGIKRERQAFVDIMGYEPSGIRMHYVRFNDYTFSYEDQAGYCFDTTEFDKVTCGTMKAPYRVNKMWEFPLAIMEGYLPEGLVNAKKETIRRIQECDKSGMGYMTILFHDFYYCDAYSDLKTWYEWLIEYCETNHYEFCSFEDAVIELNLKA